MMSPATTANPAILLLGPTGAGKTPLGELLERRGFRGAECLHFDFGQQMRDVVRRNRPDGRFSAADIGFLRGVLESGVLLEDEHFPLARRIVEAFLADRRAERQTCIVLNGLPRHVGQAQAVDAMVDVQAVIHLRCSSAAVQARIGNNVGGDRTERSDDDLEAIDRKLAIYDQRTAPLLEHYCRRGVRIVPLDVTADMTPEQMWDALNSTPHERRTELPLRPG
jgi:adenylate kinase